MYCSHWPSPRPKGDLARSSHYHRGSAWASGAFGEHPSGHDPAFGASDWSLRNSALVGEAIEAELADQTSEPVPPEHAEDFCGASGVANP